MAFPDDNFTAGGGALGALVASFDWAATPLGPISSWPAAMKIMVGFMLHSPMPMATLWGPDGIMIYNDAYATIAGARHPDVLGAKAVESFPEVADLNRRVLKTGLAGGALSLRDEHMVLQRNGFPEDIWLDLDYSPIPGEHGQPLGVLAVVNETTQRVRLEKQRAADILSLNAAALRQSCLVEIGDRLRTIGTMPEIARAAAEILCRTLNCTRAGYATIANGRTNIISDWSNGTVPSLTGEHKFDALGASFVEPIMRGEAIAVDDVRGHPITAGNPDAWLGIKTRAVMTVPLLENGAPAAIMYIHDLEPRHWTGADISLLKDVADRTWEAMGRARAIQALRELNESLERQVQERTAERDRMWKLSTDIMLVANFETKIVSVNPAWTALLGWREEELVGHSFTEFLHPQDIPGALDRTAILKSGTAGLKSENRYRNKDGAYLWISWTSVPDETFIHAVGRDVTAEKEQAEALQAAEEALRHAQKMEAVGQLTGGIAHDFNNLIQAIAGSLELVQKRVETGDHDGLSAYAANAMAAAKRAGALTHRLLAFSRRQPLDPKTVAANPLIQSMENLLHRTIGELITLHLDLTDDLWPTLCDPNQLDSAILNLAINARDAMPDGGRLTIRTHNAHLDHTQAAIAGVDKAGDYVCVCVADSGAGMSADVVARAFDPFFTTKPIGQGTGLGLSMIYGFMQQTGGHAHIESAVGQGTTVRLYLPRCTQAGADDDTLPLGPPAYRAEAGDTVLVLEDEIIVRGIVVEVLEDLGYHAIEAADGPAGLEILRSNRRIDLLVTDIGLPGLNGRQVAEAARLLRPGLKILFMTGYADSATMADGFLAPGMEMITKPFAIDSLALRIKSIIESGVSAR
jgi:PAS domain S-box-containing protein